MIIHEKIPSFIYSIFYKYISLLNRLLPTLRVDDIVVNVSPEMSKPVYEAHAISSYCYKNSRVLDLGTGTGIIGISAALHGCEVDAVDISPKAIEIARMNASQNNVSHKVQFAISNLFNNVTGAYDYILSHPPYVELKMPNGSTEEMWATSDNFMERLLMEGSRYLKPDGKIIIVWPGNKLERINAILPGTQLKLSTRLKLKGRHIKMAVLRLLYLHIGFNPYIYVFQKR